MANVINTIDSAPEGTQSEQVVSESIKSAKEKILKSESIPS